MGDGSAEPRVRHPDSKEPNLGPRSEADPRARSDLLGGASGPLDELAQRGARIRSEVGEAIDQMRGTLARDMGLIAAEMHQVATRTQKAGESLARA